MSITITTSIRIHAKTEDIWQALIQFEAYPRWNPFITKISGNLSEGERLSVSIDRMSFKPKVLSVKPKSHFEWIGHLMVPGIFDGKHKFQIKSDADGVYFEQSERFSGILVPLFKTKIKNDIYNQFNTMNLALKQYVEQ